MTNPSSKIYSRERTTLPLGVREDLGLSSGGLVTFERTADGQVIIRKATEDEAVRHRDPLTKVKPGKAHDLLVRQR